VPEYSLAQLEEAARGWWQSLPPGSVVWLSGDLGSGKTTLVQALARAAGAEPARSPSFALVHQYAAPEGLLVHVDCYRLKRAEEALDLDLAALAAQARLMVIEWPERAGPFAPAPDLHLRLEHTARPDRRAVERVA
jgi:tRNA threonylcarbamoyladenosine biosynthesis protein TsaE